MLLIDKWLNGNRNFFVGKSLFEMYSTNKAIKALLDKGETAYSHSLLVKELMAINENGTRPVHRVEKEKAILLPMPTGGDSVMKSLEAEWKPKYALMNKLRYDLDKYDGDNSLSVRAICNDLCQQILSLEQECMQIWEKRDYYEKNGRLPDVENKEIEIPTDALKLATFIQSCLRQIRRYRATKETNSKHAQLYLDYILKYKKATGNEYQEKD